MADLASYASEIGAKYVLLVSRWKGGPGKLEFYQVEGETLRLVPPLIYLKGVRLQRQYRVMWRKLRIRPRRLLTVKPPPGEALKIAEALSVYFNSQGLVKKPENPEKGTIYMEVSPKDGVLRITFHSAVEGEIVEIGPALKLRHVIWRTEKPESGSSS